MTARFYPWQQSHKERLVSQRGRDKLPHAVLLSGPACLGKRDFALALAALFLCTSPVDDQPCGSCSGCHLFDAGTHPDFRLIEPEESRQILIDQVRDLIDWVNQTSQRGGLKIVLMHPAEQMNPNAANALLKCLEEPTAQTLIMLVSNLPGRLLPTIRSRCQQVPFNIPPRPQALAWLGEQQPGLSDPALLLAVAGGAPLAVQQRFDEAFLEQRQQVAGAVGRLMAGGDVLALAGKLAKADPAAALEVMRGIFADALRLSLTGNANFIRNKDLGKIVETICSSLGRRGLLAALDAVRREQLALTGPWNPNPQLLMESLLIEIAGLCGL